MRMRGLLPVLAVCLGLIVPSARAAKFLFDATKVRANADIDSLVPRFSQRAKAHLDDLFAPDQAAAPDEPAVEAQGVA